MVYRGAVIFAALISLLPDALSAAERCDVLVYGATPGGIAAALNAARDGAKVTLVEPTQHVGGLATSGLSHQDFRTYEGLTGFFLNFNRRVEAWYRAKCGADSEQVKACRKGVLAEPYVNQAVLLQMLAEHPSISIRLGLALTRVHTQARAIESVELSETDGRRWMITARVFIDATYEGDLMAAAKVPWRVGREGRAEYGESGAPETADRQLQAYNFRLIATQDPARRVAVAKPDGYDRAAFTDLLPMLTDGRIKTVFGHVNCVFRATPKGGLPNGKFDLNDVSLGAVRLSLPGENLGWPDGDAASRTKILRRHLNYQTGLLWFLQHDEAVPEKLREEALTWGWCRDEFTDNGHLPWQLYVREARRMLGRILFTERDVDPAPGDARAVFHADSIAMGDYGPNCHGTAHEGPFYGGRHTGEFYKHTPPYQIPYGVLLPKAIDNLLVPVACSSSHVGFCALRYEPIWGSLGEAAGLAAAMVLKRKPGTTLADLPVREIQSALHRQGAATTYVADVPASSPLFEAVQWLGARGGLHGLALARAKAYGKLIEGQYFEAFPGHFFKPEQVITESLLGRWISLLPEPTREVAKQRVAAEKPRTRGAAAALLFALAEGKSKNQ